MAKKTKDMEKKVRTAPAKRGRPSVKDSETKKKSGRASKKSEADSLSAVVTDFDVTKNERKRKPRKAKAVTQLEAVNAEIAAAIEKRDRYLHEIKTLEMLLSAFGILTDDGSVDFRTPEKGTPYFYLFANGNTLLFDVRTTNWIGGISDCFRFCRGNVFMDEQTAQTVCHAVNIRLLEIKKTTAKK